MCTVSVSFCITDINLILMNLSLSLCISIHVQPEVVPSWYYESSKIELMKLTRGRSKGMRSKDNPDIDHVQLHDSHKGQWS